MPSRDCQVSTGIYALHRWSLRYNPDNSHRDFMKLVQILMETGEGFCISPLDATWLDLARIEHFLWSRTS